MLARRRTVRKRKSEEPINSVPETAPAVTAPTLTKGPSNLLILLLIAVSFFAGYLFFKVKSLEQQKIAPQAQPTQQEAKVPTDLKIKKPEATEHWRGSKDVRYVWVEYSDLECPYCKKFHPDMQKLLTEFEGKIAWVYRHFPLAFHPKAQKSAEAVECANELGGNDAFWKMIDLVFEKMPDIQLTDLPDAGTQAGVDATAMKTCIDSGKYEKKVKDQLSEGNRAGVRATPTGVIYDIKTGKTLVVEGAYPYESLKQSLNTFMAENK